MATYRDTFVVGTRVVVCASEAEGTDHEFNGRCGTIVKRGQYVAVDLDRPLKYWPNPAFICLHNLRKESGA
jgi:hypothetical protein